MTSLSSYADSDASTDNDADDCIPMAVPVEELAAPDAAPEVPDFGDDNDDVDDVDDDDEDDDNDDDDDDDDDDTAVSLGTDTTPPPPSMKRKGYNCDQDDDVVAAGSDKRARRRRDEDDDEDDYDDDDENENEIPRRPHRPSLSSTAGGLTIPFRTIKRLMKMDPSVGIVQNDAAIVVAAAAEHFVRVFAVRSLEVAREKGRNIVKYEDVATARANDRSLSFLDLLMP